mmetsp:Transcript_35767/g.93556  ORF Transcript_35767/g.93556 Transcript_35767/m.93556 type:complete len:228 (-) Transcript_35767:77-760(-)
MPSLHRYTRRGSNEVTTTYSRMSHLYPSRSSGFEMYRQATYGLSKTTSDGRCTMWIPRPCADALGLMIHGPCFRRHSSRNVPNSSGSKNEVGRNESSPTAGAARASRRRLVTSRSFRDSSAEPGKRLIRWNGSKPAHSRGRSAPACQITLTSGMQSATSSKSLASQRARRSPIAPLHRTTLNAYVGTRDRGTARGVRPPRARLPFPWRATGAMGHSNHTVGVPLPAR